MAVLIYFLQREHKILLQKTTHTSNFYYINKKSKKIGKLEFFQIFSWSGKRAKVALKSVPIWLKKRLPHVKAYERVFSSQIGQLFRVTFDPFPDYKKNLKIPVFLFFCSLFVYVITFWRDCCQNILSIPRFIILSKRYRVGHIMTNLRTYYNELIF
jgi:hypothetical protein